MAAQQRAAVEELKRENTRLHGLLVQRRTQHAAAGPAWLESQIRLHKLKAQQEEQLAQQIQGELENIRRQIKLQADIGSSQEPALVSKNLSGVSSTAKQQVILQDRLTHQKQKLDSINAGNATKEQAIQDIAKCTQAAQLLAQQLHRQLCSVQAETDSVHQLITAVEATQQQAVQLSQLLQSQDDAEHLALSAAAKQVSDLQLQHQHQQQQRQQAAYAAVSGSVAAAGCGGSCTDEEAQRVLDHLSSLLEEAGLSPEADQAAPEGCECVDADKPVRGPAGGGGKYAGLVQRLMQLEADSFKLFVQCRLADWHQRQQQEGQQEQQGTKPVTHGM